MRRADAEVSTPGGDRSAPRARRAAGTRPAPRARLALPLALLAVAAPARAQAPAGTAVPPALRPLPLPAAVALAITPLPDQGLSSQSRGLRPAVFVPTLSARGLRPAVSMPQFLRAPAALGATFSAAFALDDETREFALGHEAGPLPALARDLGPAGQTQYLIPAMAVSYAIARAALGRRKALAVLRIAAGYAVADLTESALKPLVGRARPEAGVGPYRFHPLSSTDAWFSFPSAHTVHAFALANGIAQEVHSPWITAAAYTAAGLVGLSRVYGDAHWSSDVVAGAVLGATLSHLTIHWLERRSSGS
jgi:membrane-associated phospholipid phosphatase